MKNNPVFRTLRYVAKTVWEERPLLYGVYFVRFLARLAELAQKVLLPKFIIDEIVLLTQKADVETHLKTAIFYIALSLGINFVRSCIEHVTVNWKDVMEEWFTEVLRLRLANKTLSMDFEHTEDPETLNMVDRARDGISWYSGGIIGLFEQFYRIISNVLAGFSMLAILIWKCPILIPVQIVAIILDALVHGKINKIELKFFATLSRTNRIFGYYFWELIDPELGKDIRLYDSADLMCRKFDEYAMKHTYTQRDRSLMQRPFWNLSSLIGTVKNILCYGYVGYSAFAKMITIGDISMLINAFGAVYEMIWGIVNGCQEIVKRSNYFVKFLDFMDMPDPKPKGTEKVKDQKHIIEFKNVSFKYPRAKDYTLKDVNIKITSGEHLSVVGLNGAGKTTFIKLLCRLYDVTDGEILIDGVNIKNYSEEEYKKLFAVVFQDFALFAFSLRENIALADSVPQQSVIPNSIRNLRETPKQVRGDQSVWGDDVLNSEYKSQIEYINKILKQTGLYDDVQKFPNGMETNIDKHYDRNGTEFSGGQKQKTAISRALYRDAPIVILDEPTAALDPIAEYEIYRQFNDLVGGKTAVYISHRLSSCKFCDYIAVFSEGTIKEYGTHAELVKKENGIYAKMFAEQAKYYIHEK